ncbi:MAG: NAD(P)H-dependent oxidoreductase [Bacteroidota bacterium]|nr:NAD(P)H-dependent oxidoreductase [Flavisolibacter sp.]MDQ3842445.1 NAD(P)H-dependent oxidoreductase [Bacteroidota bacterium]MBD0284805.1 NAD(P)H-dependent oxidoreductase [Flavisolibacter sp.]MBD0294570.1 NAD(P)H-dependent oxidoreductase [Flavisolibacter sp.]MBD0351814.1 NAD(P)H-dependent oxidoreductase [Flavisolibacter sp.]
MAKVLILFAHPRLETSRANKALLRQIPEHADLFFNDLYEHYPDFNIDVEREKDLLLQHDIIIWHHPFYWYSAPPIVKQWIDVVLEFRWAYGPGGTALQGKMAFNAFTSGGAPEAYTLTGHHRFTVRQFLTPFDRTTTLCNMIYLPPFAVQGTHRLSDEALDAQAKRYGILLNKLLFDDFDVNELQQLEFLNDIAKPVNQ